MFVANSWDDTISVIDTKALEVAATWSVGAEPSSVVEDREGKHLFVANRISNDVAVLDAQTGAEEKRLAAGRGASYITASPDGSRLYVTHVYPNATPHRTAPASEITVIDTARAVVVDRIALPYVAHGFHVAFSADGRLGVAADMHPKNLVPLAHLEHGGAFADTLTIVWRRMWASRWRFRWMNWNSTRCGHSGLRSRRTSCGCSLRAAGRRWSRSLMFRG